MTKCVLQWSQMKRRKQLIVAPVWAREIEVEEQGDMLLVTGRGHLSGPLEGWDASASDISPLDLLARFTRYARRQRTKKPGATEAGVYQFADAIDDKKRLTFVQEFGPVWGDVRSARDEENGELTLTVAQDQRRLQREQKVFAAAVELLGQVNRNAKADLEVIVVAMAQIAPPPQLPRLPRHFPPIEAHDWNEHHLDDLQTMDYMLVGFYAMIAIS